jgi:putative transcriptional regulator
MTKVGQALIASANEALAIARGEANPPRTYRFDTPDVAAIRKSLGLSQEKFAKRFSLSAATVRDWEQGRRRPDASACLLLRVIQYAPETVERALAEPPASQTGA